MSAIIHNSFRKYNADNFITSVGINKVYLMIGKDSAWSGASAGEYAETTPTDAVIPIPIDTISSQYIHHSDMIAAKLIPASNVSHVIKRVNWVSGTIYVEYNDLQDDIIDQDFFIFSENSYRVYKCISNYGGVASTVEPTGVSTDIIETADNYRWKFMFEVPQGDVLKFVTSDWIPVQSPADASTDQESVENASVNGALDHISVTNGGTGYKYRTGTVQSGTGTSVVLDLGADGNDDFYNGLNIFITSGEGNGQLRTITDYDGTSKQCTIDSALVTDLNATSEFSVAPVVTITPSGGSGTLAVARVSNVDAGVIKKISMVTIGSEYRFVTASVDSGGTGSGVVVTPIIAPPGGHGSDAVGELGGAFVMLNARLIGNEGADFPVGDDFRKVHLLSNPTTGGIAATGTTYNAQEIDDGTGSIIYTEFRTPINRASDSTEDIKLVVEF